MHETFGTDTKEDGSFPTEEIFSYYEKNRELPKTSGCTPGNSEKVFDEIRAQYPEHQILHLAYSASTTCSYQSAPIAAEGRNHVTSIDTKEVTVEQGMIVLAVADYLKRNPGCTLEDAIRVTEGFCRQCRMCFFPGTLLYLKAGGRVSNAAYLGAKVLSLTPLIELKDGTLVATKKYRGSKRKIVPALLEEYSEKEHLKKDFISFWYSPGFDEELRNRATETAKEMGFEQVFWFQTGGVISTYGGPGAFGRCGFSEQEREIKQLSNRESVFPPKTKDLLRKVK